MPLHPRAYLDVETWEPSYQISYLLLKVLIRFRTHAGALLLSTDFRTPLFIDSVKTDDALDERRRLEVLGEGFGRSILMVKRPIANVRVNTCCNE